MKLYVSVPDQDIIECELPSAPSIDHSIALDDGSGLFRVIGVVWHLGHLIQDPVNCEAEVWVFCERDYMHPIEWGSNVVPLRPRP